MAECSAETLHQRDHAFEVGGVLGVRAALSADSRVRPQIVTHGLEQGPPRAAGAGGHPRGVRPELLNRIHTKAWPRSAWGTVKPRAVSNSAATWKAA